jgi:hypothetical protein
MADEGQLGLVIWSTDIPALSAFLERTAGLSVEQLHPGFASLRAGRALVAIHSDEAYRGHPWFDALRKEGLARGVGAEMRFRVADVDRSYSEALRLGGRAIQAPAQVDAAYECQVMGPDGYLFSFWHAAPAPGV